MAIKPIAKFMITIFLIHGGTHRIELADNVEVANGLLIVNIKNSVKVFPLSNIKRYEFDIIVGD